MEIESFNHCAKCDKSLRFYEVIDYLCIDCFIKHRLDDIFEDYYKGVV